MHSFVKYSSVYAYDYYIMIHTQSSKKHEHHSTNDKAKDKNTNV